MLSSFSKRRLFCPTDDSSPSRKWNVASPVLSFAFASVAAFTTAFCTRRQKTSSRAYPWMVTVLGAWCVCVQLMRTCDSGMPSAFATCSATGSSRSRLSMSTSHATTHTLPPPGFSMTVATARN